MDSSDCALPTTSQLHDYVKAVLCDHDRLDPNQAELRLAWIDRAGQRCGAFFQVRGPRLLRTYAVWARDESRILFYESTGERIGETRLTEAPALTDESRQAA